MFHLRFTPHPKGLDAITDYDMSGALARSTKHIVAHETHTKDNQDTIPHYHVWIETDVCEKTLRSSIAKGLKIPTLTRGKTNGYYSLQLWTDPLYICKQGSILMSKGFSPEQIQEYVEKGKEKFLKGPPLVSGQVKGPPLAAAEGRANKAELSLVELYQSYLEDVLPKDMTHMGSTYTIGQLRSASISWWRKRSGGLLPQTSTYKRFLSSAWLEANDIMRKAQCIAEVEIEKYGY